MKSFAVFSQDPIRNMRYDRWRLSYCFTISSARIPFRPLWCNEIIQLSPWSWYGRIVPPLISEASTSQLPRVIEGYLAILQDGDCSNTNGSFSSSPWSPPCRSSSSSSFSLLRCRAAFEFLLLPLPFFSVCSRTIVATSESLAA